MRTMLIAANGGDGKVYLSNGVTRYWVRDWNQTDKAVGSAQVLADTQNVGSVQLGSLVDTTVHFVDDLDAYGVEIPFNLSDMLNDLSTKVTKLLGTPSQVVVPADALAQMTSMLSKAVTDALAAHPDVPLDERSAPVIEAAAKSAIDAWTKEHFAQSAQPNAQQG